MPQWVNASLFLVLWAFFCKNRDIFMAAICVMAMRRLADRRYFLWIVHDWIKTGFMRKKEAISYIQMVFIVCCLLLTAPNKRKIISVSRYRWCLLSVYHDIVTCSQQKLKNLYHWLSTCLYHWLSTYPNAPVHISWLAAVTFDLFLRCVWCIIFPTKGKALWCLQGWGM